MRRLCLPFALFVLLALSTTLVSARPPTPEMQTSHEPSAAGVSPFRTFVPDRLLVKFRPYPRPLR